MNREELLKVGKPILFNTETVKAIIRGEKTVTRRVIKGISSNLDFQGVVTSTTGDDSYIGKCMFGKGCSCIYIKPPYQVGNILYVRETFAEIVPVSEDGTWDFDNAKIYYYANDEDREAVNNLDYIDDEGFPLNRPFPWKPSIHMPKEAARIFLRVTDIRVERLQDIGIKGIMQEGVKATGPWDYVDYLEKFKELWNSTIKKQGLDQYGWEASPWVWVISFSKLTKEQLVDAKEEQRRG